MQEDNAAAAAANAASSIPCCDEHLTEVVKFLCQTCDKLVCRNCVVKEGHKHHKYLAIKNVSAREREAVQTNLGKTKQKISALRGTIAWIGEMEKQVEVRALEAEREIDYLINRNIDALERKRAQLKRDVGTLCSKKVHQLQEQKEGLNLALDGIKSGVEYTERALSQVSDVEMIARRKQFAGLLDLNEVALQWEPCRTNNFCIEVNQSLTVESIEKMAYVNDGDNQDSDQYILSMLGGKSGTMFTTRCRQRCYFVVMVLDGKTRLKKVGVTTVKVEITPPGNNEAQTVIMANKTDNYTFSYCPNVEGVHAIKAVVSGRCISEKPIRWEVDSSVFILDPHCAVLPPEVYEQGSESLTGWWFKHGWHSWQVRICAPDKKRFANEAQFEIGVTDGHRHWRWSDGKKFYPNSSAIVSTISTWQCGDLFAFFLDLDAKRLVIHNQRTDEMDAWDGIRVPIRPYINPQSTEFFGVI